VIAGYVSSAALAVAGVLAVLLPDRSAQALHTAFTSARGRAEFRIANAGFAGVGIWALIDGSRPAFIAVGALWIGAAAVRLLALLLDRPQTDWTYWVYGAFEVGLAAAAIVPFV
jgi:hypothetical protein